jgi:hypothetical protein
MICSMGQATTGLERVDILTMETYRKSYLAQLFLALLYKTVSSETTEKYKKSFILGFGIEFFWFCFPHTGTSPDYFDLKRYCFC